MAACRKHSPRIRSVCLTEFTQQISTHLDVPYGWFTSQSPLAMERSSSCASCSSCSCSNRSQPLSPTSTTSPKYHLHKNKCLIGTFDEQAFQLSLFPSLHDHDPLKIPLLATLGIHRIGMLGSCTCRCPAVVSVLARRCSSSVRMFSCMLRICLASVAYMCEKESKPSGHIAINCHCCRQGGPVSHITPCLWPHSSLWSLWRGIRYAYL